MENNQKEIKQGDQFQIGQKLVVVNAIYECKNCGSKCDLAHVLINGQQMAMCKQCVRALLLIAEKGY